MSRAESLARQLRLLKDERDEVAEKKAVFDYDANRVVNAIMRYTVEIEKAVQPDVRRIQAESSRTTKQDNLPPPPSEIQDCDETMGDTEDSTSSVPAWAKKTYRMIALKTHPDKVNSDPNISDSQRDRLVSLYKEATQAFHEARYESLAEVAAELGIDPGIPIEEMEGALERKILSLRSEISGIQKKLSWVWGTSFGDMTIRLKVLKQLCVLLNVKQPEESVLKDIIRELESQPDFDIVDRLGNLRRIKSGADRRKLGTRPEKRIK